MNKGKKILILIEVIICCIFLFMGDYSIISCKENNINITYVIAFTAYVGVSLLVGALLGIKYRKAQELKDLKDLEAATLAKEELLKAEELLKTQELINSEINKQLNDPNNWEFFGSC